MEQKLNRKTSQELARLYPAQYVYYHYPDQPKSFVKEGIRWGKNDVISWEQILNHWNSKPRKTPIELMLAKMIHESGRKPYIAGYEKGQHERNPDWKNFNEYQSTSYGLFQVLGLVMDAYGFVPPDKENVFDYFTPDKQFDLFDKMMSDNIQKMKKLFPDASDDEIIWHSIAHYGLPALYSKQNIQQTRNNYKQYRSGVKPQEKSIWDAIEKNFYTYKQLQNLNEMYLKQFFKNETAQVIEVLKKK
ncbi:MAG: hypothetical protein NZ455_13545 [Bacteroidia bacterium]|nr:hypothetical protein [Bacteroidia bacterium]MDW8346587.1 hypothetical protein [Bacteroidia bacterium]